jgi:Second Messenger Oligonucleotide or Dinucleotide Synthetase domain
MMVLEDKDTQLDDLLDRMAEALQLDATRKDRMKTAYEAVKDWIESDERFFKPFRFDVYPHGSVRILTTVKPISRDEFDLDIAIHLKADWTIHSPARVYAELKRRLEENEVYKAKLECKNRCLRLNYAGDFHMDILPGVQEDHQDENKLMVPDREMGRWVSSNPRGFANWFMDQANKSKESLLEKAFRAEKLPVDNFRNKKPLQRGVQLIKRFRDLYFQKDDRYKTSSIILTTLAGELYKGEAGIFDTVDGIISQLRASKQSRFARIRVLNPVNPEEDFTDKWDGDPGFFLAFTEFIEQLHGEWQGLKRQHGVIQESRILKGLFGDEVFLTAQTGQVGRAEELRKIKALGIERATGILSSTGLGVARIKPNTFHGD